MAEEIGRGVIRIEGDASGLKAATNEAKRSIESLGNAGQGTSKKQSASIDRYIAKLKQQNATIGMSKREIELYKLTLRGASAEQLKAADSTLRLTAAHERNAKMQRSIAAVAAAGTVVAGFALRKFINETIDAQNEQAQLAAVIKSTGAAAGYSAEQLNKMSMELAGSSVFSDGDITKAQTRLLSYTGIVGEQVPKAMQAVIDMASRMGMSLEQSAETVGRALDIPSQGLTALQRQGFRFTDAQKKVVEELENTGRVAEAQKIVLDALQSSYGGAALAARDTLGGALKALGNEFDSLITGTDAAAVRLKEVTEGLTTTARRVRELLDEGQGIPALIRAFAGLGKVPFDLFIPDIKAASTAKERIKELNADLNGLQRGLKASESGGGKSSIVMRKIFGTPEEFKQKIAVAKNQIAALEKFGENVYKPKQIADVVGGGTKPAAATTPTKTARPSKIANDKTKPLEIIDTFDSGSFQTTSKEVAAFIREQQDAINDFNSTINNESLAAIDAYKSRLDGLISGTATAQTSELLDKVDFLNEAFFKGEIGAQQYAEAISLITGNAEEVDDRLEKANDTAKELGLTFTSAFEDAIVEGKKFKDVLKGLAEDLLRIAARKAITEPLANAAGSWVSSMFADGGAIKSPALSAYSGSVVSSPTVFPFANGIGLMGEAGAEAILPLKRGSNGKLGVSMDGGGGGVTVQNYYTIDARGADAGAEQRIRRAMAESEDRAVSRSVTQVQSMNQRGQLRLA